MILYFFSGGPSHLQNLPEWPISLRLLLTLFDKILALHSLSSSAFQYILSSSITEARGERFLPDLKDGHSSGTLSTWVAHTFGSSLLSGGRHMVRCRFTGHLPFIMYFDRHLSIILLGDIIFLSAAGQPVIVLNSPKAVSDLLDKRAGNTSDRPRNIVGSEMLTGGLFMALQPHSDV